MESTPANGNRIPAAESYTFAGYQQGLQPQTPVYDQWNVDLSTNCRGKS
jgi:hypothetical protein